MTPKSLFVPFLLLAMASRALAGEGVKDPKEIKRLIIDVERIRRLEPEAQKKEVERLYRTLAPRTITLSPRRFRDPKTNEWRDGAYRPMDLAALLLALAVA